VCHSLENPYKRLLCGVFASGERSPFTPEIDSINPELGAPQPIAPIQETPVRSEEKGCRWQVAGEFSVP